MPALTCYRLRPHLEGVPVEEFDQYIAWEGHTITAYGPVAFADFDAQLYITTSPAHPPDWAGFFGNSFGELAIPSVRSVSAALLLRLHGEESAPYFAFVFGFGGRYLLRNDAPERSYGLRTALNIAVPASASEDIDLARIVAVDSKRRSSNPMRSRGQAARATTFEDFDVDRLRDVLSGFTVRPSDSAEWGTKVTGTDAFYCTVNVKPEELGKLCRRIDEAHQREDYRQTFPWIDNVRSVSDPDLLLRLQDLVIDSLHQGQTDAFGLAPPEIVDWTRVDGFRFHFDRWTKRERVLRPFLELGDLLVRLRAEGSLNEVDVDYLRNRRARAIDSEGHSIHEWPLWKCLFGEVSLDRATYILDEGDFFQVDVDFLAELHTYLDSLPECSVVLPTSDIGLKEADYNAQVVTALDGAALLLDARTVRNQGRSTPVEICDVLTDQRHLIHVKRGLGSGHLSHLFSQGFVSAELLWGDKGFRAQAHDKVLEYDDTGRFSFFGDEPFLSRDFEVVFAIIASWRGRTLTQALPFFSKINLRRTAEELTKRGYRVSLSRIATTT